MTDISTNTGTDAVVAVVSEDRKRMGSLLVRSASYVFAALLLMQSLFYAGYISFGFANWLSLIHI